MFLNDLWKRNHSIAISSKVFSNQNPCAKRFMETGFAWINLHVSKPSWETGCTGLIFLCLGSFHLLDFWQQVLKFSFYPSVVLFVTFNPFMKSVSVNSDISALSCLTPAHLAQLAQVWVNHQLAISVHIAAHAKHFDAKCVCTKQWKQTSTLRAINHGTTWATIGDPESYWICIRSEDAWFTLYNLSFVIGEIFSHRQAGGSYNLRGVLMPEVVWHLKFLCLLLQMHQIKMHSGSHLMFGWPAEYS